MWVEFAVFLEKSVINYKSVCLCVWRARCRLEDWLMKEKLSGPMKMEIRNEKESKVIWASRTSCRSKFGQS